MAKVFIHPPKTPVTKGSLGMAKATLPNVCKMPGPPAPFVPTPLPNIGKSGDSPEGYSTSVKIEGHAVAIQGASFKSMGDMASKALGGGMLSMNTHGATKFIGPGSLTVKIEGKAVHLKGEPMFNNCGASGSPPNSSTLAGEDQSTGSGADDDVDCEALKIKWKIETGPHKANRKGEDKKSRAATDEEAGYQSHHILQGALMPEKICSYAAAHAVMLFNSCGGTEHQTINASQTSRNASKHQPTFGQLKADAQADLVKGLAGRRGNPGIPQKEAEQLAKCLVIEAEEVAQEEARENGQTLNDSTLMNKPNGCFLPGTLIRMADGTLRPVELLRRGDQLKTDSGAAEVARLEECLHTVVELSFDGEMLVVGSYHRLFDADGASVRADQLRSGDLVVTASGWASVRKVRLMTESLLLHRVGLTEPGSCLLGRADVLAELPYLGPPLVRRETVSPHSSKGA